MFSDHFDILKLKINFLKLKNYFNIFFNKKYLKKKTQLDFQKLFNPID